ncbi:MAG: insulinase family protein [Actinomycetota bacterium]|nr:insulinase family protein [Actinomycetota bacterium]
MSVITTHLDCGLTVVCEPMPDVRSVAVGFWVGTGSRDEDSRVAGASHFLEHLLFKGTATRSARQIAEMVDEVGGDINAFTTKEYTAFYVRVLSDALETGLDILSDIMWQPAFRPDEVEAERQVILEEILMHADEPADLVHEVLSEALYPGHALGREVLGDESTVVAMPRDDIAAFHAAHYRPANIVLAAAGDLDPDSLAAGIERRFTGQLGGAAPERVAPDRPVRPRAVVTRPTEQAHLVLGFEALDRDDEDRYALAVVNHVLGGGMSSRLFQEIREERGLAYSVFSYRSSYQGTGNLAVYAGTAPARAKEVLGLIHAEIDRLLDTGITERELGMTRSHLRGSMALSLEDSGARMSRLGRSQLVHGQVPQLKELDERLGSVTLADVDRVIAKVLSGTRVLAAVGPFGEGDV